MYHHCPGFMKRLAIGPIHLHGVSHNRITIKQTRPTIHLEVSMPAMALCNGRTFGCCLGEMGVQLGSGAPGQLAYPRKQLIGTCHGKTRVQ